MYIPAFWCGVIITLLVESAAVIIAAAVLDAKAKAKAKKIDKK